MGRSAPVHAEEPPPPSPNWKSNGDRGCQLSVFPVIYVATLRKFSGRWRLRVPAARTSCEAAEKRCGVGALFKELRFRFRGEHYVRTKSMEPNYESIEFCHYYNRRKDIKYINSVNNRINQFLKKILNFLRRT